MKNVDKALKDRVDLSADVSGYQHRTGGNMLRTRIFGVGQVDVLGAKGGAGTDLRLRVGGDVTDLVGKQLQVQAGLVAAAVDSGDTAYLHAAHLDLGAWFHHQPGAIGGDRDGHIRRQGAREYGQTEPHRSAHGNTRSRGPPRRVDSVALCRQVHWANRIGGNCRSGHRWQGTETQSTPTKTPKTCAPRDPRPHPHRPAHRTR